MSGQTYFPPRLIIVTGVAGSGKSSICIGLLDLISATYIDKDAITSNLFPDDERGKEYENLRPAIYKIMDKSASNELRLGNSVIVEAPFSRDTEYALSVANPGWYKKYSEMSERHIAALKVIRCIAPEKEIFRRLSARGYSRDSGKLKDWAGFLKDEPINLEIPYGHLLVDTSQNPEKNLEKVLAYLEGS